MKDELLKHRIKIAEVSMDLDLKILAVLHSRILDRTKENEVLELFGQAQKSLQQASAQLDNVYNMLPNE